MSSTGHLSELDSLRSQVADLARKLAERDRTIEAQTRAEGALAEQGRHLLTAQALAHVGSWDWQLDSGAVTWSDEHYRIFGYTPGSIQLTGDTLLTALHPDDHDKVLASVNDALHGHHPFDLEYRIVRPNGEVRWIHGRAEVHRQATGRPLRMDGTVLDITAHKQVEEALRASEERWHLAVRGSNDGIWDWDVQTGQVFFSTRWKAMRGYEEHELSDSLDEWRSRIHPDDMERVLATVDAYLARQRSSFCEEYRSQRKDGSYMWILDRGAAIWDGQGTALRMAGSETDITERKQAENALRESEARTRSIIETALDAVITIDRESRILGWNSQATSIFGYAAHEAIGRNLSETIIPLRFRHAHAAGLARVFQSDEGTPEKRRMEFSALHRDGHEFPIEFAIAMTYIGGQPVFSAFVRDITEQKQAAESLAQREGQLRTVLEALPVGVWFTDAQGRVLLSNPAARELWAGVQHIGIGARSGSDRSNWWETTGPAAEPHRWMLSDVLTKGVSATDDTLEIACEDGTRKIVRNSAAPVRADDGSIQGAILVNEDITARVKAEHERARTQAFLESIIENIPHMITVKDTQNLRFVTVNRAAEQFFERSRTDLIGSSVFDILDRTEASLISSSDTEVLARNSSMEITDHVVNSPSRGPRVLRTKKLPIFASQGRPQHLLSISEDVTERARAEEVERRRVGQLLRFQAAQLRMSKLTHVTLDADFRTIVEATAEALHLERVSIWVGNDAFSSIVCQDLYTRSNHQHQSGHILEASHYPQYFAALESALLVAAHHAQDDPRTYEFADHLAECQITSRLDVPVRQEGVLIGVLCHEHVGPPREWSPEEEAFAISIADHIALCLAAAERRRVEAALRASEARFRTMAEAIPQQVWTATPDGHLDYVNPRCVEYFQVRADSLTGANWQHMIHPDDLPLCLARWTLARTKGLPYEVEFRLLRASDQTYRWHIARALPLCASDGHIIKWIGSNTDVTEVKQAEEALRQHEQDLRRAMEDRERISQDLHDGILQSLYAVGLGLESCKPLMHERQHDQALETMGTAIRQLNHIMAEVRNFIAGLESEVLQGGNFEAAVRTVINTVTESYPLDCRVRIERAALGYVPTDRGLQVLNILREALSNSVRHAKASQISVSVRRLRRTIRLRIHDNGIGFDLKTVTGTGHGLLNMAARAKKIGAEFELHPAPGRGTTITLDLPKEDAGVHG